jgi:hypothetical protein
MLVDVSHVVEHGMVTYRGLPAPLVCDFLSREQSRAHYAPGTEFHIQGFDVIGVAAVFDSVPHFRGHTQEIVHMTRLRLGDAYKFAWTPTTPEQGPPA